MLRAAIDTSSTMAVLSVADETGARLNLTCNAVGQASARLLLEIQAALAAEGLAVADVRAWFVGMGPGSFSGIRSGAALIAGICRGSGAACHGVPSSFAMASAAPGLHLEVLTDGRRGEVIRCVYRRAAATGRPELTAEPDAVAIADLPRSAAITRVMLATDPARTLVEAALGPVATLAEMPVTYLFTGPAGPLAPVYVRPAVFTQPR